MMGETTRDKQVLVAVVLLLVSSVCATAENSDVLKKRIERFRKNAEWVQPLQYISNVTDLFTERLQEYGVGNLPIPDKVYDVNVIRYHIPLRGQLEFTNGFVANIMNISHHPRDFIWFINDDGASVQFKLLLSNVSVFYNLRADLQDSDTKVTAVLTFPASYIQVLVNFDVMTHTVGVKEMTTTSVAGPKAKLTPDSSVMKAIAYNIRLTMANSLFTDLRMWIEKSLQSLMEIVVKELHFPITIRRIKRRPGSQALGVRRRRQPDLRALGPRRRRQPDLRALVPRRRRQPVLRTLGAGPHSGLKNHS